MTPRILLFAALALAAPLTALAGCNVNGLAGDDPDPGHPTVGGAYNPDTVDGGGGGSALATGDDSGVAQSYLGSPLCNASRAHGCYPDDPATAKRCVEAPDGGVYNPSGGYDNQPLACHVQPGSGSGGDGGTPVCLPVGPGMDGAQCQVPTDCGPSYECVIGDGAYGTCRKYCCSGNTECGSTQFCDIQSMAAASVTKVPVCMPIAPTGGCHLLDDASCQSVNPNDTCAVVRENGETSCVAVGPAKAGDLCDEDHCGRDLVCLGTPGERRCYQLCHTAAAAECSSSQACKGGLPLFPDSAIGICQP